MTDLGDSKDDAESLLEQLKEFTDKSMVSGTVLECLLERKVVFKIIKLLFFLTIIDLIF